MAFQYNPIKRLNPQTKEAKWYAASRLTGKRGLKDLSKDLAEVSSLSPGDVHNVIVNLIDQLPKWLMQGSSVKLDGFGTFRLSFSSDGVETKEEVTANLIKDIRIIFEPDDQIKERIAKTQIKPAMAV
jgi:predicted histone-like DNA-binding protein